MAEDKFGEYIGKLWSMIVWGNKKYISEKLIESNGFNNVKNMIIDLLYGTKDLIERWNNFYTNVKHIGPSSMSELLSYINLNEYIICNKITCACFRYLDVESVPVYNYKYTGENYKRLCSVSKDIKKLQKESVGNVDLLVVDYMFWDIIYPLSKRKNQMKLLMRYK